MVKRIELSKGLNALVDDADYDLLNLFKWSASSGRNNYAVRRTVGDDGRQHTVYMHRVIMEAPKGLEVDHINGNMLDNRRENLRLCSRSQNARNQKKHRDNSCGFKGVYKRGNRFGAQLTIQAATFYLGTYSTAEEAARAYDEEAKARFGEFAKVNFP